MPVTLTTIGTAMAGVFVGLYRAIGWVLLACVAVVGAYWLGYSEGRVTGAAKVAVQAVQAASIPTVPVVDVQRVAEAQAQADRATTSGRQHEAVRQVIDTRFTHLTKAIHESPPTPAGAGCAVPAGFLRIWSEANAGPVADGSDLAPGQPDASAPAAAPVAPVAGPQGPGGEPRADGAHVPPAGQPDVQPDDLPASPHGGV